MQPAEHAIEPSRLATRDYERAAGQTPPCEHPHGYEFDADACPICGWAEPEPGTIHDGWCEGHANYAVVLERAGKPVSVWRLTVDLDDPPRRLMEEALEALLCRRGESALVTIERASLEGKTLTVGKRRSVEL